MRKSVRNRCLFLLVFLLCVCFPHFPVTSARHRPNSTREHKYSNVTLVAMPTGQGLGNNMMGLFVAIIKADQYAANVAISKDFFICHKRPGHKNDLTCRYDWAKMYIPDIPWFDTTTQPLEGIYKAPVLSNLDRLIVDHHNFGANFGGGKACPYGDPRNSSIILGKFCNDAWPGMFDKAADVIRHNYAFGDYGLSHQQWSPSDEVKVVWHIRTGDIVRVFNASVYLSLRETIDQHFTHRKLSHMMLTQNRNQALSEIRLKTINEDLYFQFKNSMKISDTESIEEVTALMMQSDILISMGSSLNYIIPAMRNHSSFVHFYFPPKEMYKVNKNDGGKSIKSEKSISENLVYQSYFIRVGVVPVYAHPIHHTAEVFHRYKQKMHAMLRLMNRKKPIPLELSHSTFEHWQYVRH